MRLGVPRERRPGERRVALVPNAVASLGQEDVEVVVEAGAGGAAGFADEGYRHAGAAVTADELDVASADLVLRVGPPTADEVERMTEGAGLVGFLDPFSDAELLRRIADRGLTAFAMEAVPRTTLAQTVDALSSQATAAGYAAAMLAASVSNRIFPMLTTAAGTVSPVKALVLGAGVAGLQAIATCRRLGAVVSGYDIRPAAREEIESLGARFVGGPVEEDAVDRMGYAREVSEDVRVRQLEALADHVAGVDVVIATAQVPGRRAPVLVTEEMVARMAPGSIVVDVAAPDGGNCEVTVPGERVERDGVIVLGPLDLPSRVAHDASQLYSRNLAAFVGMLVSDGKVAPDLDDEIVGTTCVVEGGTVRHPASRALLGLGDEGGEDG
jgi:H+-translocating NAD(P) transhydrogenase subunit alpha